MFVDGINVISGTPAPTVCPMSTFFCPTKASIGERMLGVRQVVGGSFERRLQRADLRVLRIGGSLLRRDAAGRVAFLIVPLRCGQLRTLHADLGQRRSKRHSAASSSAAPPHREQPRRSGDVGLRLGVIRIAPTRTPRATASSCSAAMSPVDDERRRTPQVGLGAPLSSEALRASAVLRDVELRASRVDAGLRDRDLAVGRTRVLRRARRCRLAPARSIPNW